jgi:hypothetical protein
MMNWTHNSNQNFQNLTICPIDVIPTFNKWFTSTLLNISKLIGINYFILDNELNEKNRLKNNGLQKDFPKSYYFGPF